MIDLNSPFDRSRMGGEVSLSDEDWAGVSTGGPLNT